MIKKIYKIKPLEWIESTNELEKSFTASTPFGRYFVTQNIDQEDYEYNECYWGYCFDEYHDEDRSSCSSIAEGKKIAQKHWIERIGGALLEIKTAENKIE